MGFKLLFTPEAKSNLLELRKNKSSHKQFKAVRKCLGYLEINPRHPGLNTHKYISIAGYYEEDVFEAYAENNTPGAFRIFWHYGPQKNRITIIAITQHP